MKFTALHYACDMFHAHAVLAAIRTYLPHIVSLFGVAHWPRVTRVRKFAEKYNNFPSQHLGTGIVYTYFMSNERVHAEEGSSFVSICMRMINSLSLLPVADSDETNKSILEI